MFYLILVILTSRFEATQWLFWEAPRNFEPHQMTRTTPEPAPPSPTIRGCGTNGRTFGSDGFNMHLLRWNRVSKMEPSGPEPRPYHQATAAPQMDRQIDIQT
ncbi:hypothetical protein AVEN_168470-1 [Araneus ventricosus]|uniref:Secreted protein n=1 Tax=Araneus ventricosus TaxID=182803 RepID=A0A4Y2Q4W1_ARAVE|nr:hypothetical protein AVEN_168470-1 [Araneus ventricosus]